MLDLRKDANAESLHEPQACYVSSILIAVPPGDSSPVGLTAVRHRPGTTLLRSGGEGGREGRIAEDRLARTM
jgi:hypothetical protein